MIGLWSLNRPRDAAPNGVICVRLRAPPSCRPTLFNAWIAEMSTLRVRKIDALFSMLTRRFERRGIVPRRQGSYAGKYLKDMARWLKSGWQGGVSTEWAPPSR